MNKKKQEDMSGHEAILKYRETVRKEQTELLYFLLGMFAIIATVALVIYVVGHSNGWIPVKTCMSYAIIH